LFGTGNRNSVVEFSRSGQDKIKTRPCSGKKNWELEMTFTGTLIDDLMAAVERVEQAREALFTEAAEFVTSHGESAIDQRWFASIQENAEYDPKFLGVA
jgi:hypothetical protein